MTHFLFLQRGINVSGYNLSTLPYCKRNEITPHKATGYYEPLQKRHA